MLSLSCFRLTLLHSRPLTTQRSLLFLQRLLHWHLSGQKGHFHIPLREGYPPWHPIHALHLRVWASVRFDPARLLNRWVFSVVFESFPSRASMVHRPITLPQHHLRLCVWKGMVSSSALPQHCFADFVRILRQLPEHGAVLSDSGELCRRW